MRKAVAIVGLVVSAVFLLLGLTVNVPNDYLEYYGADKIEKYVGGDAYNYIIASSLRGAQISAAKTSKAMYLSAAGVIFVVSLACLAQSEDAAWEAERQQELVQSCKKANENIESCGKRLSDLTSSLPSMLENQSRQFFEKTHAIPDVIGKHESEARNELQNCGYTIRKANTDPAGVPEGIVQKVVRDTNNYNCVIMSVEHPLPDVIGKQSEAATELLKECGFEATVQYVASSDTDENTVLSCQRNKDGEMKVVLRVSRKIQDLVAYTWGDAETYLKGAGLAYAVFGPQCPKESDIVTRWDWSEQGQKVHVFLSR